jgi:hypothetical protein
MPQKKEAKIIADWQRLRTSETSSDVADATQIAFANRTGKIMAGNREFRVGETLSARKRSTPTSRVNEVSAPAIETYSFFSIDIECEPPLSYCFSAHAPLLHCAESSLWRRELTLFCESRLGDPRGMHA